jgi:nitrite reductase (NAD(P)H)
VHPVTITTTATSVSLSLSPTSSLPLPLDTMAPVPTEVKYEGGGSEQHNGSYKKKCVVVGLGMVGIAFIEKLLKYDIEGGRDEWEVVV